MYYLQTKLQYQDTEEHRNRFGGYNDLLPGMEKITEQEFNKLLVSHLQVASRIEYRQVYPYLEVECEDKKIRVFGIIAIYDGTGRAGLVIAENHYPQHQLFYFRFAWEYSPPCELLEDSGWEMNQITSRPSRGILDYYRTLKFERTLTGDELDDVTYWLTSVERCPGWTGINYSEVSPGVYVCRTTHDSSD